MSNDRKQVKFTHEKQTVEAAKDKLEYGELSEELRATLDRIAHGADVAEETRLTDRVEQLREERRELQRERDDIVDKIEETERDIERVERRLEELRETNGEYDGVLAMLEGELHDGVRVMAGTDTVKRAASIGDCTPEDVINDLRDRNPDVPDMAFRPARGDAANWKDAYSSTEDVHVQLESTCTSGSTNGVEGGE